MPRREELRSRDEDEDEDDIEEALFGVPVTGTEHGFVLERVKELLLG